MKDDGFADENVGLACLHSLKNFNLMLNKFNNVILHEPHHDTNFPKGLRPDSNQQDCTLYSGHQKG